MEELIGKSIGPYKVLERIGEGGMAVVYKGFQESLNRYVAIKVLRGELARDEQFVSRFRQEAMSAARLSHPNVLHVYDAGLAYGNYYIVMDYVDTGSLKELLQKGSLDPERAASITAQVAEALDHAHRKGLVHRDVKPANILISADGRPLLADFGIARALDASTRLTRTGTQIGTPEYMAPEQAQGDTLDGRTDIYALGIVLYEMLTGQVPFRAHTPVATLYKHVNEPLPPIRQEPLAVPAWLEQVVKRCLAKHPEERFQTAGELAQALRERRVRPATEPRPPKRRPTPVPEERKRKRSLVPVLVGAIALLILVMVVTMVILLGGGSGDNGVTPVATQVVLPEEVVTQVVLPDDVETVVVLPDEVETVVVTPEP